MDSSLPKKPVKRARKSTKAKAVVPSAGQILETKLIAKRGGLSWLMLTLILLVIGSVTVAAMSFQQLSVALGYASSSGELLNVAEKQAANYKNRLQDLQTLQALAQKAPPSVAIPADLVWEEYSSHNIAVKYPQGFTVEKATSAFPVLTIRGGLGRLEIFRMQDFPNGARPAGADSPKMMTTAVSSTDGSVVPYNVWVYYGLGDELTRAVLEQMAASVQVVK